MECHPGGDSYWVVDPRYIYLHEWLIFDGKLQGKYDSPLDPMGNFLNVSMVRV